MGGLLSCFEPPSSDEEGGARKVIKRELGKNRVMVFSKTYCPFCSEVKGVLSKAMGGRNFGVMELNRQKNMAAIQNELAVMTGARTVPRVFIDGVSIGGCDDTLLLFRNGQLKEMMVSKGIL